MRRFLLFAMILMALTEKPACAVEAVANHARFRTAGNAAVVELYWQINTASLHYRKDSAGRLSARIRTQLRVTGDTGVVYREVYYLQTRPFYPDREPAPPVLEQARLEIPSGPVLLELYLSEDGHPETAWYHKDTFTVLQAQGPAYSSLQLLDTFFASQGSGPFEKGQYFQLPRVLPFYGEGQRSLHAYLELYGTSSLAQSSFPLVQTIYLSRRKGERDLESHVVKDTVAAPADLLRFRYSFTLEALPSGNYYVNANLRSASGAELASGATFFQTVNKNPVLKADTGKSNGGFASIDQVQGKVLDLSKTFVDKFDMAQLRAILKMLLPTASASEVSAIKGFLERPDELYMRYFIYNQFVGRNKADPARAWKEFSDVIREVNRLYKSGSTMGYETDRGIIHLRFGPPVEVIRVPNEAGAVPYEIWRYNVGGKIGGSGLFLFYSPGYMTSDFRLLHSTVPGERQNPGWRGVLYVTGRSSGNMNARAEEYFGK